MIHVPVIAAEVRMTVADGQDSAEAKIRRGAASGELVDLHHGEDHFYARYLGPDDHASQEVPAGLLIELLTGTRPPGTPPPRAVRVCGAVITGSLRLEAATLACPLMLELCRFTEAVILDDATAPKLSFSGCHVPAFSAKRLRTAGNLVLDNGFTADAGVHLIGAHVGGQLALSDARISRAKDADAAAAAGTVWALAADGMTVEEDIFARRLTADGQVRLLSARVKGQIDMTGADIDASADGQLANAERIALFANHLTVDADAHLWEVSIKGQTYLRGARIGGQLILDRAHLASPGSSALEANHITVGQEMSCCEDFTSDGEVDLATASIGGHLTFNGATLSNPGRPALNAEWITIGKSLVCGAGFSCDGEIRLSAAQVGGQLLFLGASLGNPAGAALSADRIDIGQSFAFSEGSAAAGAMSMRGARITGHVLFRGGRLSNPGGTALDALSITVGTLFRFREGFAAEGQVSLEAAKVGGPLVFDGVTLSDPGGTALNLAGAVTGALSLCPAAPPSGTVELTAARTGAYTDDPRTWPSTLKLRGFIYDTLENSQVSVRERLRWLALHPGGYTPQVYDQLAACYRSAGHDDAARRVAIAKQRHRRSVFSPLNWLWYVTVGYGYRTWLAAVWLAALTIAGTLAFSSAHSHHLLIPGPQAPAFHPLIYTLDTLLPVIDFGQEGAWTPTGWALPWSWSLTAAGWALTTAAVAALTGIFKRD